MPYQSMINFFAKKKKKGKFHRTLLLNMTKTILCMLAQYVDFLPPVSRTGRIQTDARKLDQSVFRQRNLVHVRLNEQLVGTGSCWILHERGLILTSSSNFGLKVDSFFYVIYVYYFRSLFIF